MSANFYQVPRALLDSDRSGLAVAAWCLYETLQTPDIAGGRLPARARRCWIADQLGVSERTLDRARAELLTDDGDGPFLAREIRGRNRSALHFALSRPQETGQPYAVVPAWSLARIRSTGRSKDEVCPETWRAYAVLCARLDPQGHDLTLGRLGEWLHCSSTTARRRLHALEEAGWVRVRRTDGLWMHVQAITDEHQIGAPAPAAPEIAQEVVIVETTPITPAKSDESPIPELSSPPLPNLTTPYGAPSDSSPSDSSLPLAVGDLQHRKRVDRETLRERPKPGTDDHDTGTAEQSTSSSLRVFGAPSVMCVLPLDWQTRMSEAERERVLAAIETEMAAGRSVAEMSARVRRRLAVWRGRRVRRPVAAALTVVRRGYDCPRLECENHLLPSGTWCGACTEIGARANRERLAAVVGGGAADGPPRPGRGLETVAPQPPLPPLRVAAGLGAAGVDAASSPCAAEAIAQARAELAALRRKPA